MGFELRSLNSETESLAPLVTPDADNESTQSPPRFKYASGWKFGLIAGASGCIAVFVLNLSVTIWSLTLPRNAAANASRKILKEGSCSDIRRVNVNLHLLINILSSTLLATSNYGMQCLSAPTRGDVDNAHSTGNWMDIGIPSMRNLRSIPWKRTILWALLVVSSVPLHLL